MTHLRVLLALCLLGLLAASIAEDTAQLEQEDAHVESEVKTRGTYKDVLSRQQRHCKYLETRTRTCCVDGRNIVSI